MHRIAFPLALALVAGIFSTTAFGQQATSFGTGQQEANILGSLMARLGDLETKHAALARKVSRLGSAVSPTDTAALAVLEGQIGEIKSQLTALEAALDGKADIDRINDLIDWMNVRFHVIDQRLAELEGASNSSTAISDLGQRVSILEEAEDAQTVTHTYTSNLNVIGGLGFTGRFGDPDMDQDFAGGQIDLFGRLLWPLTGGSSKAAGLEVSFTPYGSGQGVGISGIPTVMFGDLVTVGVGIDYRCDGYWTGTSGCSANLLGGMGQVTIEKAIAPFVLRGKGGAKVYQTDLGGGRKAQEAQAYLGLDLAFGSTNQDD